MSRPTKQTVNYFPHFCKHGKTIYILEKKYGNNGYAFWFKLLEELGSHDGHILNLSDETELEFLSAKTGVSSTEAVEMLELLSKLGAIDKNLWNKKMVWCQNFIENVKNAYNKRIVSIPEKPISGSGNEVSGSGNEVSVSRKPRIREDKIRENNIYNNIYSKHIVEIINLFKPINPMISFNNKTYRNTTAELIEKFGFEKVKSMIEATVAIQGKDYAPTVTNPWQFKKKLGDIKVYFERQKSKQNKTLIINE
jgi:hypothetical protein